MKKRTAEWVMGVLAAGTLVMPGTTAWTQQSVVHRFTVRSYITQQERWCDISCEDYDVFVLFSPNGKSVGELVDGGELYVEKLGLVASLGRYPNTSAVLNDITRCTSSGETAVVAVETFRPVNTVFGRIASISCAPHRTFRARIASMELVKSQACDDTSNTCTDYQRYQFKDPDGKVIDEPAADGLSSHAFGYSVNRSFSVSVFESRRDALMRCLSSGDHAEVNIDFDARTIDVSCK